MNFDRLHLDKSAFDFHEAESLPQNFEIEIVLVELLPKGFFPKAYMCPSMNHPNENVERHIRNNFKSNHLKDFILLGEVLEFKRGTKNLFLKDGKVIFFNHLVIVSESHQSEQRQEEEFHRALQCLLDAIRFNAKMGVKEKLGNTTGESVNKLRAMTKIATSKDMQGDESLAAIQNSGKQSNIREPQTRLFELHP